MALHKIIFLPDPRLRKPNAPITEFNDALQTLIDDMFETMYHAKGVGLAAPQIAINLQLSVIDVSQDKSEQLVIINPKITHMQGNVEYTEGCLSVPGAYDKIFRAETVTVQALDRHGNPFEITADGLLGECLQHEIDHLNGTLFVDKLSPIRQAMVRKKLEKFKKEQRRIS